MVGVDEEASQSSKWPWLWAVMSVWRELRDAIDELHWICSRAYPFL